MTSTGTRRSVVAAGERAGVRRIVVVSIIGLDRFSAGCNVAKVAHEQAMLSGPIPVQVLRAARSTSSSASSWTGAGRAT